MKFTQAFLHTLACELPTQYLSSQEIETELAPLYERNHFSPGRLELMTGVHSRGLWPAGTTPSSLATRAAEKALASFKGKREDIDLLINASVCRDFLEPATASLVHANLKLPSTCRFFDLSNACLGAMNALTLAAQLVEAKQIKNALIVAGENSGPLLNATIDHLKGDLTITRQSFKPYLANLTIGSAAIAFIVSAKEGHSLCCEHSLVDSSANELCRGGGTLHELTMQTDSERLLQAGVRLAQTCYQDFLDQYGESWASPQWVLTHQVGRAHEALIKDSLRLSEIPTFTTYQHYGNTGSAALPLTLALLQETGDLKSGDSLTLMGIGSGLSASITGVHW